MLKILAIGFYDDFARFFLSIKKEYKQLRDIEFRYLSIYASGFLYTLLKGHNAVFLPLKIKFQVLVNRRAYLNKINNKYYKGINLEDVIQYHTILDGKHRTDLLLQAASYIDYFESYLVRFSPDIIILSGDTRLPIQTLKQLAQQKGIKIYYFEQGPFGTTIFDSNGVNANASIRSKKDFSQVDEIKKEKVQAFLNRPRKEVYKRNPFYRGFDYLYQILASKIGLLPAEIFMEIKTKKQLTGLSIKTNNFKQRSKTILLILQVPYDANMVFHSPLYRNHADIVRDVFESLPTGYTLLVREHPLYKHLYEESLYDYMIENQIELDGLDLISSLKLSDIIVVNNSTVGIEAIAIGKPVLILGDCYYDNADIALKLQSKMQLSSLLEQAIKYEVDLDKVYAFLYYFLFEFLVDGHFRDSELIAPKYIVNNRLIV